MTEVQQQLVVAPVLVLVLPPQHHQAVCKLAVGQPAEISYGKFCDSFLLVLANKLYIFDNRHQNETCKIKHNMIIRANW